MNYDTPYTILYPAKGNGESRPCKSRLHGKTVVIRENSPSGKDIPSFEHGFVHLYDAATNEYYGICGESYFAACVGLDRF